MEDRLQDGGGGRLSAVLRLIQCITGPQVRRQYYVGWENEVWRMTVVPRVLGVGVNWSGMSVNLQGVPYRPNRLEHYADNVILAVS